MKVPQTLAYCDSAKITAVKGFIEKVPAVCHSFLSNLKCTTCLFLSLILNSEDTLFFRIFCHCRVITKGTVFSVPLNKEKK